MPVCAGRARLPRRVRHTQFRGMVGSACVLLTGGFWGTFSRGDHAGGWLPRLPPLPEQTPPGASQQVSAPPQPPQNSSLGGGGSWALEGAIPGVQTKPVVVGPLVPA